VWREAETCGTAGTPADILAVMLGTNDCLQMREPSAGPVARKLAEMLAALTELRGGAGPRILVLAPPAVEFGGAIFGERPWIPEVRLTDAYREAAEEAGALFVDTAAWDLPMSFDRVHLSEEGHRRMAEELAACLRKIGDSI
jgi:lysophospholipase L1-like esterase